MPDRYAPFADDVPALTAHIVERYHEAHRRDLPALAALAQAVGPVGVVLAEHLQAMAAALELHMFKEEMRLFPMLEQGGNTLAGHLIDDLESEHRLHEDALARLGALTAGLPQDGHDSVLADLRAGVARFTADLVEHVRLEDQVLFRRFEASPRTPGPTIQR